MCAVASGSYRGEEEALGVMLPPSLRARAWAAVRERESHPSQLQRCVCACAHVRVCACVRPIWPSCVLLLQIRLPFQTLPLELLRS